SETCLTLVPRQLRCKRNNLAAQIADAPAPHLVAMCVMRWPSGNLPADSGSTILVPSDIRDKGIARADASRDEEPVAGSCLLAGAVRPHVDIPGRDGVRRAK